MKLLTSLLMAFTVYAQPVVKTKLPEASKELKKLAKEFHRVGNGGHPFEKEWRMLELEVLNANANAVSQGQQAADTKTIQDTIDRTYIFVTDDVFVTAPSGLLVEKAAKNFIQNNFWHIQISARIWPTLTKSQKMDLIYHELLGLNGLESNNYDVSAIVNLAPAHFTPSCKSSSALNK